MWESHLTVRNAGDTPATNNQVDLGSESFPLPPGVEWLRLRIEPVSEGFSYWGFVSVTNNETQLISIVTPQ